MQVPQTPSRQSSGMLMPLRRAASSRISLPCTGENRVLPSAKLKATLWFMARTSGQSEVVEVEHRVDGVVEQQHVLAGDLPALAGWLEVVGRMAEELLGLAQPVIQRV